MVTDPGIMLVKVLVEVWSNHVLPTPRKGGRPRVSSGRDGLATGNGQPVQPSASMAAPAYSGEIFRAFLRKSSSWAWLVYPRSSPQLITWAPGVAAYRALKRA